MTELLNAFAQTKTADEHPHLAPINRAPFRADGAVVVQKAGDLLAYQRFLADARAAKARQKGASASFERSVLAQGRQAREDMNALTASSLRMVEQVNQTQLWDRTLARGAEALTTSGPRTIESMWSEVIQTEQLGPELAKHGVSAELTAAITDVVSRLDATASVRDGRVYIETQLPTETHPRRAALAAAHGPPATLQDLLRRSQFDGVVAALAGDQPALVDLVPAAHIDAYTPPDLFAIAAVAGRKRLHEHVRKLEDSGLATYEGNDPLDLAIGLIVVGLILGGLGSLILYLCDDPPDPNTQQPEWLCTVASYMVLIATYMLFAAGLVGFESIGLMILAGIGTQLMFNMILWHSSHLGFPFD